MSITTKTGDDGSTALMFGRRILKNAPQVVAGGACDELNAALGAVRAFCDDSFICDPILAVQKELVTLMGELAVIPDDRDRYRKSGFTFVSESMVESLTARIHDLEANHRLDFKHWATPGATRVSALLDVARAVCRRAERAVVDLRQAGYPVSDEIVRYLNRLSDLCWLYARYVETKTSMI